MKISYLGAGAWGYCLAVLLAKKGYEVSSWTIDEKLAAEFQKTRCHPLFPELLAPASLTITSDLEESLLDADLIVEGVTSAGLRSVLERLKDREKELPPIVLTSKGIEQDTGLLLADLVIDVLGADLRSKIACLSGPSHAEEVIRELPSSVTCSAYDRDLMFQVKEIFSTPYFRVYPNEDLLGVEFGGAVKNIIAIACGISDGLGFGDNTKAALLTRGLHEMRKLSLAKGCRSDTLNGLSGMGDLCVTCFSPHSRNYRFGRLIAGQCSVLEAKEKIGQVVEGAYTCVSVLQLSQEAKISAPITECVHDIIYKALPAREAVKLLMERRVLEEHL